MTPVPIERARLQELIAAAAAQLVEVLPREEYDERHLPGAINIPLKELNRETVLRLDCSQAVVVYCYDYQ